jgi:hypothetical protein
MPHLAAEAEALDGRGQTRFGGDSDHRMQVVKEDGAGVVAEQSATWSSGWPASSRREVAELLLAGREVAERRDVCRGLTFAVTRQLWRPR